MHAVLSKAPKISLKPWCRPVQPPAWPPETWYQQEFLHPKDGGKLNITGQYEDDYVKVDGRWYFSKRIYNILNMEQS